MAVNLNLQPAGIYDAVMLHKYLNNNPAVKPGMLLPLHMRHVDANSVRTHFVRSFSCQTVCYLAAIEVVLAWSYDVG